MPYSLHACEAYFLIDAIILVLALKRLIGKASVPKIRNGSLFTWDNADRDFASRASNANQRHGGNMPERPKALLHSFYKLLDWESEWGPRWEIPYNALLYCTPATHRIVKKLTDKSTLNGNFDLYIKKSTSGHNASLIIVFMYVCICCKVDHINMIK